MMQSHKLTAASSVKLIAILALVVFVITNAAVFIPVIKNASDAGGAYAYADSGSLTVKVGYQGTEYIEKKVFTSSEINSLSQNEVAYSYIDMFPAPCLQAAKGVYLEDLVNAAGIDVGSVQRFHFVASDSHQTLGDMTALSLLHTDRYFYPELVSTWDNKLKNPGVGAEEGRRSVKTMIAVKSYTERNADNIPWDKIDAAKGYRLCFGMPSVNTMGGAHDSVHDIIAIEVQLVGSPPDEGGKNDKDDTVGSDDSNKDNGKGEGEENSNNDGDGKKTDIADKETESAVNEKPEDKEEPKDKEEAKDKEEPKDKDKPKDKKKPIIMYTVSYDANGGVGSVPAAKTYAKGSIATVAGKGDLTREGYIFTGWSTNKAAKRAKYGEGDSFIANGSVRLYAVWKQDSAGGGKYGENTGKAGPKAGHGQNPGVASPGETTAAFGGGQNLSIAGGLTTVANPKIVSGAELKASGNISEVGVKPGGLTDKNNPWVVYEISPESTPLKLPPPKDGTMPIAVGLLGGAFAVGGLYSFTSLSTKGLWLLRKIFLIK